MPRISPKPANSGTRRRKPNRRGVPLTVYLSDELSDALSTTATERRVDKATIVRAALERFLQQLDNGQMDLPLGL